MINSIAELCALKFGANLFICVIIAIYNLRWMGEGEMHIVVTTVGTNSCILSLRKDVEGL